MKFSVSLLVGALLAAPAYGQSSAWSGGVMTTVNILGPKVVEAVVDADGILQPTKFHERIDVEGVGDRAVQDFLRAHPASQLHNLAGWLNRCVEFVRLSPAEDRHGV